MYTVRQLIEANRKALADRTLGAFTHADCLYDYGDGCRCAIGVVLTDADLEVIRFNDANQSPVAGLVTGAVIEIENISVFSATQKLHDAWLSRRPFFLVSGSNIRANEMPKELYNFLSKFHGQGVMETNFVQWLDQLDKHYPAVAS